MKSKMDKLFAYTKAKKQNLRDDVSDKKTAIICIFWRRVQQKWKSDAKKCWQRTKRNYYSDANQSYQNGSYNEQHFFFRNKSHTFTVKSVNSDIRKYITALQRNSKCFFRSMETFQAIMCVFYARL